MSKGARWFLAISFLLLVAAVFLVDLWKPYGPRDAVRTFAVRDRGIAEEPPGLFETVTNWNDEAIADIGRFESQIEEESVLRTTVPVWQWFQARVLDSSGTARVLFGRDDWLFLRENVELSLGRLDSRSLRAADEAVRELAAILEERGTRLILVPIPPKPEIHPYRFSGRFRAGEWVEPDPLRKELFERWTELPNVEVLPVREILVERAVRGEPAFLERDTHWNPDSMEEVAGAIAVSVGKAEAEGIPAGESVSGQGDLVRMLDMGDSAPFTDQQVRIHPWGGEQSSNGELDLVLLGDSFAAVFSDPVLGWGENAGLVDQLRNRYGIVVKDFVNHGDPVRSPRQSLKRYLKDGGELPEVVVWQFAERFLSEGDWEWRMEN